MILITEFMHPAGLAYLTSSYDGEVVYAPEILAEPASLAKLLPQCRGLVVRNKTQVNASLLEEAMLLQVVGRLGVGLDNIDQESLRQKGIQLIVPKGANAQAVAEYVIGGMLDLIRRYRVLDADVRRGAWDRTQGGTELHGKSIGILGYGAIGRSVAHLALAFGMTVKVYDPWVESVSAGIEQVQELAQAIDAHFVSLHLPSTPDTKGIANRAFFTKMPKGSFLINTSRGDLVNESDLAAAVHEGHLAGALLDVREQEPPAPLDPFLGLLSVLTTPHVAGLTAEAQKRIGLEVAKGVLTALT